MSAWVGCMKAMPHQLEDIRVDISDEDNILTLMMGLNKSPEQPTLEHVISHMLNEEVHCGNIQVQGLGVKGKEKNGVRVKKEEGNVALVAT